LENTKLSVISKKKKTVKRSVITTAINDAATQNGQIQIFSGCWSPISCAQEAGKSGII
jgi:hypothetical protein